MTLNFSNKIEMIYGEDTPATVAAPVVSDPVGAPATAPTMATPVLPLPAGAVGAAIALAQSPTIQEVTGSATTSTNTTTTQTFDLSTTFGVIDQGFSKAYNALSQTFPSNVGAPATNTIYTKLASTITDSDDKDHFDFVYNDLVSSVRYLSKVNFQSIVPKASSAAVAAINNPATAGGQASNTSNFSNNLTALANSVSTVGDSSAKVQVSVNNLLASSDQDTKELADTLYNNANDWKNILIKLKNSELNIKNCATDDCNALKNLSKAVYNKMDDLNKTISDISYSISEMAEIMDPDKYPSSFF